MIACAQYKKEAMKKIINFLLVGVLFSVISCQRTDDSITPPSEQKDNFFNLNVGNKWVYKTYDNPTFYPNQSLTKDAGNLLQKWIGKSEGYLSFNLWKELYINSFGVLAHRKSITLPFLNQKCQNLLWHFLYI